MEMERKARDILEDPERIHFKGGEEALEYLEHIKEKLDRLDEFPLVQISAGKKESCLVYCPTCRNEINRDNKRLVCEICRTSDICESCDEQMTRTYEYLGYRLKMDWPLCRKCYRSELDRQKFDIRYGFLDGYERVEVKEARRDPHIRALDNADMEPIFRTGRDDDLARVCAYLSMILGIISIFAMGFLLGIPAILLGYAAKVRRNPLGNYGMAFGLLGLASSIFWFLLTGGGVWFL